MVRPPAFAAAAAALAAALLLVPATDAGAERVRVIDAAAAGAEAPWRAFDTPGPTLFDLDGDGAQEIIDQNENRRVVVLDGRTGALRAELQVTYPPYWDARPLNQVTAAVMAPGEPPSLVVANSAAVVTRFTFEGERDGRFAFAKAWERRVDEFEKPASSDGAATVADLDGDGRLEVLAQTEKSGAYALRGGDGSVLWAKPVGGGNAEPTAGDLDGDGRMEAVFASDGGHITVLDGPTGNHEWTYWAGHHVRPASISVMPTLADLEGDGKLELLFTARDARDEADYRNNHLAIIALGHDGKERFAYRPAWGHPLSYTHLVASDVDGDGRKEVFGSDWNTIGHKPGNWERLGPSHVFSLDASGQERWRATIDNTWSNDDVAVADLDGDGAPELLAVGYDGGQDGIVVLDARTGAKEGHAGTAPWQVVRGPEVGDVDGDGRLDIVVSVAKGGGGFMVLRASGPSQPVAPPPSAPEATSPVGPEGQPPAPGGGAAEPAPRDDEPARPAPRPPRPPGGGLPLLGRLLGL